MHRSEYKVFFDNMNTTGAMYDIIDHIMINFWIDCFRCVVDAKHGDELHHGQGKKIHRRNKPDPSFLLSSFHALLTIPAVYTLVLVLIAVFSTERYF